jgi:hypothetical protein
MNVANLNGPTLQSWACRGLLAAYDESKGLQIDVIAAVVGEHVEEELSIATNRWRWRPESQRPIEPTASSGGAHNDRPP